MNLPEDSFKKSRRDQQNSRHLFRGSEKIHTFASLIK